LFFIILIRNILLFKLLNTQLPKTGNLYISLKKVYQMVLAPHIHEVKLLSGYILFFVYNIALKHLALKVFHISAPVLFFLSKKLICIYL